MIILKNNKSKALSGANNNRLTKHRPTNNAQNAAWADVDKLKPESKVSIPSLSNVEEAKDWVDNGSRL
ncbi:MAG: CDIF630_02480 family spore surface protein [Peptostreptococcaceae bacterium]